MKEDDLLINCFQRVIDRPEIDLKETARTTADAYLQLQEAAKRLAQTMNQNMIDGMKCPPRPDYDDMMDAFRRDVMRL